MYECVCVSVYYVQFGCRISHSQTYTTTSSHFLLVRIEFVVVLLVYFLLFFFAFISCFKLVFFVVVVSYLYMQRGVIHGETRGATSA